MINCIKVVPYDKSFELKDFDCGESVLNKYLTNYASQFIDNPNKLFLPMNTIAKIFV